MLTKIPNQDFQRVWTIFPKNLNKIFKDMCKIFEEYGQDCQKICKRFQQTNFASLTDPMKWVSDSNTQPTAVGEHVINEYNVEGLAREEGWFKCKVRQAIAIKI